MTRSVPVATIRGTAIRLHWTFILFLGALLTVVSITKGPIPAISLSALVVLMFVCVLLHEFGHITMARAFGISTPEVILLPIGGLAKLKRIPNDPEQELAIAIAGPVVNFALFTILVLVLGRWPDWGTIPEFGQGQINLVEQLAIFNLIVGLFNLLPAFPMDGGRILRALLGFILPHSKATRIATRVGQAMAVAMATAGLMGGNIILTGIGLFIFFAAGSEAQLDAVRNAMGGVSVGQVMVTGQPVLAMSDPMMDAADAILHTDYEELPVLNPDGSLAGFVLRAELLEAVSRHGLEATVREATREDIPLVSIHAQAAKAADLLERGAPAVGVVDRVGSFLGLVTWRNLLDVLAIRGAVARHERADARRHLGNKCD